jgi:hypothetical protein
MDARDNQKDPENLIATAHAGIVAKSATDFTSLVPVILPDFDEHLQWGPCRWNSRDAVSLPIKGDPCLVVFSNTREPWIIAWWPF